MSARLASPWLAGENKNLARTVHVAHEEDVDLVCRQDGREGGVGLGLHRHVLVHERHNPRRRRAVNRLEVRVHERQLAGEEALVARVEVRLGGEDDEVREALVEGVVARRARARVGARKERGGVEARLVLGEVTLGQGDAIDGGAIGAALCVCEGGGGRGGGER